MESKIVWGASPKHLYLLTLERLHAELHKCQENLEELNEWLQQAKENRGKKAFVTQRRFNEVSQSRRVLGQQHQALQRELSRRRYKSKAEHKARHGVGGHVFIEAIIKQAKESLDREVYEELMTEVRKFAYTHFELEVSLKEPQNEN